jgi:hypothetical protein
MELHEALTKFRSTLEGIEAECVLATAGEKVGGNIVKAARYEGETIGVRMVIDALSKFISRQEEAAAAARHPMDKDYLQQAAQAVQAKLPDNHGFLLLVTSYGEAGRLFYVSSMERESALNLVKEWLLKAGAAEDWMRHIK